jgi:hypothetical protein
LNIKDIILSYNKVGIFFNSEFENNFFITFIKKKDMKKGLIIKIFSIIIGVIIIYTYHYENIINTFSIISNIFNDIFYNNKD